MARGRHHRPADPGPRQTQEVGSAFPPGGREAAMMRRPGRAPTAASCRSTTIESIWRVIHLDLHLRAGAVFGAWRMFSVGESAMAGFGAGFISAFVVPYVSHFQRAGSGGRRYPNRRGDLALVPADASRHAVVDRASRPMAPPRSSRGCRSSMAAPTIRRRCRCFVVSSRRRQRHGHRSRDLERAGVRLERRGSRVRCRHWRKSSRCRIPPSTGRGAAGVGRPGQTFDKIKSALIEAGRLGALIGSRRAAMQRAIRCPRTERPGRKPG